VEAGVAKRHDDCPDEVKQRCMMLEKIGEGCLTVVHQPDGVHVLEFIANHVGGLQVPHLHPQHAEQSDAHHSPKPNAVPRGAGFVRAIFDGFNGRRLAGCGAELRMHDSPPVPDVGRKCSVRHLQPKMSGIGRSSANPWLAVVPARANQLHGLRL
jgi:hypothetical protein